MTDNNIWHSKEQEPILRPDILFKYKGEDELIYGYYCLGTKDFLEEELSWDIVEEWCYLTEYQKHTQSLEQQLQAKEEELENKNSRISFLENNVYDLNCTIIKKDTQVESLQTKLQQAKEGLLNANETIYQVQNKILANYNAKEHKGTWLDDVEKILNNLREETIPETLEIINGEGK